MALQPNEIPCRSVTSALDRRRRELRVMRKGKYIQPTKRERHVVEKDRHRKPQPIVLKPINWAQRMYAFWTRRQT